MEENKEIQNVINKLQDKLKPFIFEYISWFVPADKLPKDKSGREMMACLDHHGKGIDNKHKHMKYYPETGTFHCFACGKTLSIFDLANLYESKPLTGVEFYTDNVKYLCDKFGIDTDELDELKIGKTQIKLREMYHIMGEVSDYITANYNEKFLRARNIDVETAGLFKIGGILNLDDFKNFLKQFKENVLKELHILKDDGNLNTAIFNKNKLIMSIKDINGNVVSFSSREMFYTVNNAKVILRDKYHFNEKVLKEIKKSKDLEKWIDLQNMEDKHIQFFKRCATISKYMHTKENPLFKKREILYGFNELKNKLNKTIPVYIIEGNIDVVTAYQKGIYCLSLGGDAITDEQLSTIENELSKYTNKIVLSFDNDNAGKESTYKYSKNIIDGIKQEESNNKYYVLKYLDNAYKDIDENLKVYNDMNEFSEAITLFEYYMNETLLNRKQKEVDVISDFVKIISLEESPLLRKDMISDLFSTIEKISKQENRENKFTIKDIENEVRYIITKADETARKQVNKIVDKFKNKIKTLDASEIKSAISSMTRELDDVETTINKTPCSIFDVSLNKFKENQELKYTEDPIEFNCGYDMFNNRSWVGDEFMVVIAKPHVGKTQFMTNVAKNYIELNNNTAVLYISTDDNSRRIENNFIAQVGNLNKDFVNEPKNNRYFGLNSEYKNKLLYQEQFKKATNVIEHWIKSKRLVILESALGIKSIDMIIDAIEEFANDKTIKDFRKLVILDSANKVQINGVTEEYSKLVSISSDLKTAGQKNRCMIMANFETKKFNTRRQKTTFNSIKGSASIEYDVDFAIALSNPMAELQNPSCIWLKQDGKQQPILVPYVSKSKPGGDIMKAYFYKIDNSTTIISNFDEEELKDIKSKWFADNNNKESGYVNE